MEKFEGSPLLLKTPHIRMTNGHYINVFDPECIFDMSDIAIALSHIPRFLGRGMDVRSVAAHSCWCADLYEKEYRDEIVEDFTRDQLGIMHAILLHDTAEAFIGDIPSPIKRHLPDVVALEKVILDKILAQWNLLEVYYQNIYLIKEIDAKLLEFEWHSHVLPSGQHGDEIKMNQCRTVGLGQFNNQFLELHTGLCADRGLDAQFGTKYQNAKNINFETL